MVQGENILGKQILVNLISILIIAIIYGIYEYIKNKIGRALDRKHDKNMASINQRFWLGLQS